MNDGAPGVEVAVRDRGIGIDAEHLELIFEKFYQVGSVDLHSSGKTSYKGGGPGLGLAIVKGVARAHGGKTWAESAGHDEVNFTGSTFYLQLPVDPPKPNA
jgi:signal transduction histidine kinase